MDWFRYQLMEAVSRNQRTQSSTFHCGWVTSLILTSCKHIFPNEMLRIQILSLIKTSCCWCFPCWEHCVILEKLLPENMHKSVGYYQTKYEADCLTLSQKRQDNTKLSACCCVQSLTENVEFYAVKGLSFKEMSAIDVMIYWWCLWTLLILLF